jgi:metacaspase-1
MKRLISMLVGMLFVLPVTAHAERYALLVGIDAYPEPATLQGCIHDVKTVQDMLVERFDFAPQHVKTVLNADATFGGIQAAFRSHLIEQAQPDDTVVFYYSGHGTRTPDHSGDEEDGIDETLCPVDINADDDKTWLTDDRLGRWLERARTQNVAVIIDACFSGTITRGEEGKRQKTLDLGFNLPPRRNQRIGFMAKATSSNHVLLASSSPDQTSWMLQDEPGSVFTHFLTRAMSRITEGGTYQQVMQQVLPKVQEYVKRSYNEPQTPQLEGQGTIEVFAAAAAEPQPQPVAEAEPETSSELVQYQDFPLTVRTNQRRYRQGELMTVTVTSARDCYLRLYVINADQEVTQLFPNKWQQDHFIRGGEDVRIPGENARFRLRMTEPFGRETLKAVASTAPFEDLQGVNWKAAPFLEYGRMGLSEINMRGVEVEKIPEGAELSQAAVLYEVSE